MLYDINLINILQYVIVEVNLTLCLIILVYMEVKFGDQQEEQALWPIDH